ncbi:MAG TPA: PASTA domain-containing protein [Gaiellaceae bacterium]|nr:PASTA domain-containing protein [Gaiellaceae bacterium]
MKALVFRTGKADARTMRLGSRTRFVVSAVAATALLALIPSPAGASGRHAGAMLTVTVSIAGSGGGWVTSDPAGISCGSTCSAQFPDGTLVTLDYTAAIGSVFKSWSAAPPYDSFCPYPIPFSGPACWVQLSEASGDASVQVAFDYVGPACMVPNVVEFKLAHAEYYIKHQDCKVGVVRYAFSRKVAKGRVISQDPEPGWLRVGGAVDLVVSRGRR